MKNLIFFNTKTTLKKNLVVRCFLVATLFFTITQVSMLHAQGPKLSIQGILKKANGDAVTDGTYNVIFKLYTVPTAGTALWTEEQPAVDVISGIYSTVLGNSTPLTISFNQLYYLGVTVGPMGSTEMTPRIQLTSAPYALSLIGNTNQFPSSGVVIADSVRVNGGVLARGGAPGANGANKNGYAFTTNNGDKDSGLFCTALNQVSLYVNNAEKLKATVDSVVIKPTLRLGKNSNINYNGLDDWRLVEVDNFQTDNEGWKTYGPKAGESNGWNNISNPAPVNCPTEGSATNFTGKYLLPGANNALLKKYFDLTNAGPYTQIKVKFKYYFLDTWNARGYNDNNDRQNDVGYGAFASSEDGNDFRISWWGHAWSTNYVDNMLGGGFQAANKWGGTAAHTDCMSNGEMTAFKNGTDAGFWCMFGTGLNEAITDERWGVGMIEIWVK
jgi:hypothetical protein